MTPNAVEAVVSRLRRKLDEAGVGHRLRTVRGLSYILADERT
ncbi:MAG: helix-turn-helix domain-containing protein [Geminicoccaceae bacterium]